jgi:hypothetical protein
MPVEAATIWKTSLETSADNSGTNTCALVTITHPGQGRGNSRSGSTAFTASTDPHHGRG